MNNLYLLRVYGKDTSLIKFGYSSTIQNRLEAYSTTNPLVEIIGTYHREDGREFELNLHKFIPSEIGREWYKEDQLELLIEYITGVRDFNSEYLQTQLKRYKALQAIILLWKSAKRENNQNGFRAAVKYHKDFKKYVRYRKDIDEYEIKESFMLDRFKN